MIGPDGSDYPYDFSDDEAWPENPQSGEHIDTVLGEILDELKHQLATVYAVEYQELAADIAENYIQYATQAIKNIIEGERTRAKIEAYQHIRLSDNGMQEPLSNWLDGYIGRLKDELRGRGDTSPPTPVKGERGKP